MTKEFIYFYVTVPQSVGLESNEVQAAENV